MQSFSFFKSVFFLTILLFLHNQNLEAQLKAFPGAEGYGQDVTGGRGGSVIEVVNLNDSGAGSLREAVGKQGPRTIVFRVSGTIALQSDLKVKYGDLTIAGQTSPGGICLKNYTFYIGADNVIIRYMRFRLGDEFNQESDATWGRNQKNIIIDHCSMSWSVDECASYYDNKNFTMQWCLLSESLYHSVHPKGDHGYGGIWGGWGATFHHNLLASHTSRNPRFNGSRYTSQPDSEIVDFVNNVIFNWGFNSAYGGEGGNQNVRLNYYKPGPATSSSVKKRIVEPSDTAGFWYVDSNFVEGASDVTADNWNGGVQGSNAAYQKMKKALVPFPISPVTTQSPEEAFDLVLENCGANFPVRDTIDQRIIEEAKTGITHYGGNYGTGKGIIDSQTEVGGWAVMDSLPVPVDMDRDGMADDWELVHSLNPNDKFDRNNLNEEGYTMLEVYLNDLVNPDTTTTTSVKEAFIADNFQLFQNYPNPFNPSTIISYSIPAAENVTIKVYDLLGKEIATLVNENQSAGIHKIKYNAANVSSGFYIYRITAGNFTAAKKMMLLK